MGFETKTIRIAMNGITGRMGYRQHLLRSILPIRDAGGFTLEDGTKVQVEPILVGRNEAKIRELAELHKVAEWTTDLDSVINDPTVDIIFDASMTSLRAATLKKAMLAGKHIFTEKPTAETLEEAIELARIGKEAGVTAGVVHDKLYLPAWSSCAAWLTRASSAASCPSAANSATGSSRATCRQHSARPGTTARKTAAE